MPADMAAVGPTSATGGRSDVRVLVTGAAGDPSSTRPVSIGAATALALAPIADQLCLLDRNGPGMAWTRERLPASLDVRTAEVDLRDPTAMEEALQACNPQGLAFDVVASVAGATTVRPFFEHDAASLADEVTLNLLTHMWLARLVLPAMCAQKSGSFVCIGSDSSKVGAGGLAGYTAAKGGLMSFVRTVAKEVGPSGVRVNCVSPGPTNTPSRARLAADDVPGGFRDLPPLGRLGEPEDVADAVVFLASARSGYITGQTISVNGGLVTV
jgi:2-hydroxycyclohexanecarboxyl-CoA dehydrogenase